MNDLPTVEATHGDTVQVFEKTGQRVGTAVDQDCHSIIALRPWFQIHNAWVVEICVIELPVFQAVKEPLKFCGNKLAVVPKNIA